MERQSIAGGSVTIRPIRADEVAAFRVLRLEALREHPEMFGGTYAEALARPIEEWAARLQNDLGGPRGIVYVAEQGNELIGMTGLGRPESERFRHTGMIWGVYVRRDRRGQAIADALLKACVDWAISVGIRIIRLSVVTTNTSAIRLYARHGFTVYGIEAEALFYDGRYQDELLMARRVAV